MTKRIEKLSAKRDELWEQYSNPAIDREDKAEIYSEMIRVNDEIAKCYAEMI